MREFFESLSWIDLTALAVVVVFFVLGLFRGLVWQVSRVATLVCAYGLSAWFGPGLARAIASLLAEDTAPEVSRYIAYFVIFLVSLILFSLLASALHRFVQDSPLSFYNRIGGGILGVATGWLIVMALLTGVHMAHETMGFGGSVAEAAATSRSQEVSETVLQSTSDALPDGWRDFTDRWHEILTGPVELPEKPGDARPTDSESGH